MIRIQPHFTNSLINLSSIYLWRLYKCNFVMIVLVSNNNDKYCPSTYCPSTYILGVDESHLHVVSPGNVPWTAKSSQHHSRIILTMTIHTRNFQEARGPTLIQLNVEGRTKAKRAVTHHLAQRHWVVGILLQETHSTNGKQLLVSTS